MPYHRNYPATVAEVLDDHMTFRPECLRAMRAFRRGRPYRGPLARRAMAFAALSRALAGAYGIPAPTLIIRWTPGVSSGASSYCPTRHRISLLGEPSVVTFLHEIGHARGFDERQAVRWSVNLFRRIFPCSFARCRQVGHTLIRYHGPR